MDSVELVQASLQIAQASLVVDEKVMDIKVTMIPIPSKFIVECPGANLRALPQRNDVQSEESSQDDDDDGDNAKTEEGKSEENEIQVDAEWKATETRGDPGVDSWPGEEYPGDKDLYDIISCDDW
ncbi:hypothetical protein DL98DRAFT_525129 [Cadophora sp. DSE1049]|nr:hypothetical protein DL98DRAFT_525129 [Cadophora sp. DSE1049]